MATFGNGIRYDIVREQLASTVTNGDTLLSVSATANFFIFINLGYQTTGGGALATGIGGNYDIAVDGLTSPRATSVTNVDFVEYGTGDYGTVDPSNRIIWPGESVLAAFSDGTAKTRYFRYTKIYFGGQASQI